MLAAFVLVGASALPLGVWPETAGPPATVVKDIELYTADPEDDYWIIAVQPVTPPLEAGDEPRLKQLAEIALRLGADAVILLGELAEAKIPTDVETPLAPSPRFAVAAYVSFFDPPEGSEEGSRRAVVLPATRRPSPVVAAAVRRTQPLTRTLSAVAGLGREKLDSSLKRPPHPRSTTRVQPRPPAMPAIPSLP